MARNRYINSDVILPGIPYSRLSMLQKEALYRRDPARFELARENPSEPVYAKPPRPVARLVAVAPEPVITQKRIELEPSRVDLNEGKAERPSLYPRVPLIRMTLTKPRDAA